MWWIVGAGVWAAFMLFGWSIVRVGAAADRAQEGIDDGD